MYLTALLIQNGFALMIFRNLLKYLKKKYQKAMLLLSFTKQKRNKIYFQISYTPDSYQLSYYYLEN